MALSSTSNPIGSSANRFATPFIKSLAISAIFSFVNGWNTIISSTLFKNSGLKYIESSLIAIWFIFSYFSSREPACENSSIIFWEATFDVIITTVFLKFTTLPLESVNLPSSNSCSNILNTSGWAFSISSSSITE